MWRDGATGTIRLNGLYAPIADELETARRILTDELISDQAFIGDLCRHVEQFHGKMLRPALVLLTAKACGGLQPAHAVLAAVVELVHVATLVHDDLLDEADIRRRAATVNRLCGNERAVLMGDFLYSHAYHLCSSLDSQYAARLIGQTAITVCEGEMMQVANRGNFDLTEKQYFEIITRKTATLIEACCHLGARYAGADEETVQRLCAFGTSLGVAFQISDDLLDLTGDESQVGKSLGRDMFEGELTLPLIRCLAQVDPPLRNRILELLGEPSARSLRQVGDVLTKTGALDYARRVAQGLVAEARACLDVLPPSDARDSLVTMAEFVAARRH